MNETSDVISDNKLISLSEGHIQRSSIDYEQLLRKAVALLKEKVQREDDVTGLRARIDSLTQLNKTIREKSVRLHAKAEQEEEFISNMLLKRIQKLKNDKEALALKYEQEEEFLTNDLTRKLSQLQSERDELAGQVEAEQSWVVDTLLVKIRKLEAEISANHSALEQLRREKVDLEIALEHEQESLFNTLGKRLDQLEAEKRRMQARLDQMSVSEDHSPAANVNDVFSASIHEDAGEKRSSRAEVEARKLREECTRQRSVITTLKGTIANLQQQISLNETKYVSELLAMREKSAERRGEYRRARAQLEADLTRSLDMCRAFTASEAAREAEEDKTMTAMLNKYSIPKSITPTVITVISSPRMLATSNAGTDVAVWHDERPLSARSESQGDRMEEGSEAADTDGDTQMEAAFVASENMPESDEIGRFQDEHGKGTPVFPSSFSSVSNEDSNESSESASAGPRPFARPALPLIRPPLAKKEY